MTCIINVRILKSEILEIVNFCNPPHFTSKVFAPAHFCSAFSYSVMSVLSTETFLLSCYFRKNYFLTVSLCFLFYNSLQQWIILLYTILILSRLYIGHSYTESLLCCFAIIFQPCWPCFDLFVCSCFLDLPSSLSLLNILAFSTCANFSSRY